MGKGNQELWEQLRGMSSQMRVRAKRRFGQHFLRDTGILERIVRLIRPQPGDAVLEIGAGHGALSVQLAPMVAQLVALEIDSDCLAILHAALEPFPSAEVEPGDILTVDLSALASRFSARRLRVVGNLPYNIATVIIQRMLASDLSFEDMTFMVQLEVAQRITSPAGSRDYGYFSVFCGHRADARLEFKVSPACFVPRPKVTSAIITLRRRQGVFHEEFEGAFEDLAKAAFGHRRKTLVNSLKANPRFSAGTDQLLVAAGIDGRLRPEQLSVADYERLADVWMRKNKTATEPLEDTEKERQRKPQEQ